MLIIPATVGAIRTRQDGTVAVTIDTQHLTPDQAAILFALHQKYAFVAIKPEYFGDAERETLAALKAPEDEGKKTKAQRLRAVLYRLWQSNSEGYTDFEQFYAAKMERIIEHYKGKI